MKKKIIIILGCVILAIIIGVLILKTVTKKSVITEAVEKSSVEKSNGYRMQLQLDGTLNMIQKVSINVKTSNYKNKDKSITIRYLLNLFLFLLAGLKSLQEVGNG